MILAWSLVLPWLVPWLFVANRRITVLHARVAQNLIVVLAAIPARCLLTVYC